MSSILALDKSREHGSPMTLSASASVCSVSPARESLEGRVPMQPASPPAAGADSVGSQLATDRLGAGFLDSHDQQPS